ncbi:autotransporter outer membrane beta-barrel domain-containing protein [Stenotrophomonas lactitubi]|uniref:autotransporter outer membrane beta-barrel domain-containing protein n=1 Tax=Stenotrophomonas lactitubi TaxID=2045214 RepID=UPI001E4C0ACB|nr:autotransporter outer membrane beta-barrel domain-containing protein [Stenotrophomonas lactitubi]
MRRILDAAASNGKVISQVVFRDSPGGDAAAGRGTGELLRQRGITSVFQGKCISACGTSFIGGVERRIANYDLPELDSRFPDNIFMIHGSTSGDGKVVPIAQQVSDEHYAKMMQGVASPEAIARVVGAINGMLVPYDSFLYYYDPKTGKPAQFCPTKDNCTVYDGVDILSDRIITNADRVDLSADYLRVAGSVRGDLNPNFYAGQYEYASGFGADGYGAAPFDAAKIASGDVFGMIRLERGGTWLADTSSGTEILWAEAGNVNVTSGARLVTLHTIVGAAGAVTLQGGQLKAEDTTVSGLLGIGAGGELDNQSGILVNKGGQVAMAGGTMRAQYSILNAGARLEGHGTIAATGYVEFPNEPRFAWNAPEATRVLVRGGDLHPQGGQLTVNGYVSFSSANAGRLLFDITPETSQAGLVLGPFEVHRCKSVSTYFQCGNGPATQAPGFLIGGTVGKLALDVAPGYYRQDLSIPLVEGRIYGSKEGSQLTGKLINDGKSEFDTSIPQLQPGEVAFTKVERQDGSGYSVDLTSADAAQRVFHPRNNSLLSFSIRQTGNGIWAVANPAFDDVSLFANAASGAGLGEALRTAASQQTSALHPLLGILQFADRDVIAQQAGALRGDGHASLRLADNALVGSIGSVVQQHQAARRSGSGDAGGLAAQAAQAASAQPGMANGSLFNQLAMHLVEPAGAGGGNTDFGGEAPRNHGLWGRGFGSHGRIDGEGGVAGLSHTVGGIVLGADTQLADDRVTLGVSVAAADMSTKGRDGSGFTGDVRALDVGGYLDATYSRGYLSASVRYTDLRHDTRRSIEGIDGLQGPLRAKYNNDAISARLEHGFSFTTAKGVVIQPLLPVVDYARTSATRFNEGQGAGALVGRGDSLESIRVGAGLQLFKTFEGNNGERITPRARVVWQKELGDTQARYSTGFAAAPDLVFGASSQTVGEQVLAWNLGVTSRASDRLSVMVDYVGERRDGQLQNGVMLGLGYTF